MIRHIVLCKFKASVSEADISSIWADLDALKSFVPGIRDATFGSNASPEGLNRGYTHGFIIDFDHAAARDAYLVHPEHQLAGARLVDACEGGTDGLLVLDI